MKKFIITEEEKKSIRGLYGLNEQTNTLTVSGNYTATNCDELHAFQSTGGKVIGNMNVIVGDKIKEWNSNGINVKPTSVTVGVNGMTVSWNVSFEKSDVNWVGFTSRGAGCNGNVDYRAGNDSINNGPKSIISALQKQGKTVDKIEIVNDYKYDGGSNTFKQVFYRYTLVDKTSGNKPTPQPSQPTPQQPQTNTTPRPNTQQKIEYTKFEFETTDLNTLNADFKEKVNTYIINGGNKNYNVDDYFSISSKDGITTKVKVSLNPDENGYNRFSVLLNEKGKAQESLNNALSKNPGSKRLKNGTITIKNKEYEWHLVGLHV